MKAKKDVLDYVSVFVEHFTMTPSISSQTDLRQMSASLEMTMNQSREISQQMKERVLSAIA
jgi:hypothetical protein